MVTQTLTNLAHPGDMTYRMKRQEIINDLLQMDKRQVGQMLQYMAASAPNRDDHDMTNKILGEIRNLPYTPPEIKGILDSTTGTTGNVLIRQDLEPLIYRLYVDEFPAWERMRKAPSNGLVHAATQITQPDTTSRGSSFTAELGTVAYTSSNLQRASFPVSVMTNGRGVSLKEIAAVAQGGAGYNPQSIEQDSAMTKLAADAQWALMQGNATNNTGTTTNEAGPYNALAYDGWRGLLGSVGAWAGNNAGQTDLGSMGLLNGLQFAANQRAQVGGKPTLCFMSINAKGELDMEQQANVRYNQDTTNIIPGVNANQVRFANGVMTICPVPGDSIGTYNRTSDGVLVEDMYLIDERNNILRWLYSENWTILQIPTGVDGQLSDRIIIFGMWGLEQAAPIFNAKVRKNP